ncbi:hypothetical protein GCM10020331_052090 [Ectobacillus funiculus]
MASYHTWGGIGALVVIGLELFVFRPLIPELVSMDSKVSPLVGMLTFLQGGVYEEVQLRLFLMTLIVWMLSRVFRKQQGLKPWMYWTGILGAALFIRNSSFFRQYSNCLVKSHRFSLLAQLYSMVLSVCFAAICIGKKGLEYAMIAYAVGDIILHGLYA